MWVAPTKTLKCNTLEEIYLLLKSSDRIAKDLNIVKSSKDCENSLPFCLVLKQWRDINPCTEFRCFVIDNELIGNLSLSFLFLNCQILLTAFVIFFCFYKVNFCDNKSYFMQL